MNNGAMNNDGRCTGYFSLERWTRQGDPLFPYLSLLLRLFIQIMSDSSKKCFRINDVEIKLSANADDAIFFAKDSQSLQRIPKLIKKFQVFSL